MNRLASAKVQKGLAIAICTFRSPTHGVNPVGLKETEFHVSGEQSLPLPIAPMLAEEQSDCCPGILHIDGATGTLERGIMLAEPELVELLDNLLGCQLPIWGLVSCLAHLDHANQVAFDVPGGDQLDKSSIGKPAVNQEVIESDAAFDCVFCHLDGLVGLLHAILLDAFLNGLSAVVFTKSGLAFLRGQSLWLVFPLPPLPMQGEVEHQLAGSIREEKRKALVANDAALQDMRPHAANQFSVLTCLGGIRVVDNQTYGLVMRGSACMLHLPYQLEIHRIEQLAPSDIAVIHETVEHVLFTGKQTAEGRTGIPAGVLDSEERKENEQVEHLQGCELAVGFLPGTNLVRPYVYVFHYAHYVVECTIVFIF